MNIIIIIIIIIIFFVKHYYYVNCCDSDIEQNISLSCIHRGRIHSSM